MENQTNPIDASLNPYRNMVLDEVIQVLDQLRQPFGNDTIESFQMLIRAMKD